MSCVNAPLCSGSDVHGLLPSLSVAMVIWSQWSSFPAERGGGWCPWGIHFSTVDVSCFFPSYWSTVFVTCPTLQANLLFLWIKSQMAVCGCFFDETFFYCWFSGVIYTVVGYVNSTVRNVTMSVMYYFLFICLLLLGMSGL